MSEQSHAQREIRDAVRSLEHRVDARFGAVDRRFDAVDRRIDSLDDKVSRQFVWMVGIQVTTLVATSARCRRAPGDHRRRLSGATSRSPPVFRLAGTSIRLP